MSIQLKNQGKATDLFEVAATHEIGAPLLLDLLLGSTDREQLERLALAHVKVCQEREREALEAALKDLNRRMRLPASEAEPVKPEAKPAKSTSASKKSS